MFLSTTRNVFCNALITSKKLVATDYLFSSTYLFLGCLWHCRSNKNTWLLGGLVRKNLSYCILDWYETLAKLFQACELYIICVKDWVFWVSQKHKSSNMRDWHSLHLPFTECKKHGLDAKQSLPECIYNPITAIRFSIMFTFQLDNTKR